MRPPKEETWLHIAAELAQQGTCARRAVGCVLVDARNEWLGGGYNGPAAGQPHCLDTGGLHDRRCAGADCAPGTGLDLCEAIHAEANALLRCRDIWSIDTAYVTASPCVHCVKLLLNTSCRRVVFIEPYAHDGVARELWTPALTPGITGNHHGPTALYRQWVQWPGKLVQTKIEDRSELLCPHGKRSDEACEPCYNLPFQYLNR